MKVVPGYRWIQLWLAGIPLVLLSFNLSAQNAQLPLDFDSTLQRYVNDRWLYGSPQGMFEDFERRLVEAPIRTVEWGRKLKFDDSSRKQFLSGMAEFQRLSGTMPLTLSQIQNQHQLWSDCMVESYRLKMTPEKKVVLNRAAASGIFQIFPRFAKALEDWPLIALANLSQGNAAKASDGNMEDLIAKDKSRFDRLNRYQSTYFTVTNSFGNMLQIQSFIGYRGYLSLMSELFFMSEDLPSVASKLGISEKQWLEIEAYSSNKVASEEDYIYRQCVQNDYNLSEPFKIWMSGVGTAMKQYFEQNPSVLQK